MFDGTTDQAAGLRRLFRTQERRLIPAGSLVAEPVAHRFIAHLAGRIAGQGHVLERLDRQGLGRMVQAEAGGDGDLACRHYLWLDEPIEMAQWVDAQAGDRMLLILSHRREARMMQYAQIKRIVSSTGIRRFGLMFADLEQISGGRQAFLGLAACAGRFLGVRLDVVLSGGADAAELALWSGLSTAPLSDFEWSSWSDMGLSSLTNVSKGVAH
ncbi:MAG: hypothetical protein Q4D91_01685 [Lautropia sp.]|nr:hypothetical protein [Lautropia sp.]